jgi:predicted nucleotidyltransferase
MIMRARADNSVTGPTYSPRVQETRRDYSSRRLRELAEELAPVRPLLEGHPLCVYATGSYGRLEAWSESDIDLFFLYDGAHESERFPWTIFVRLAARLIEATEEMGFPPFSGDGRYLELQYVREMERVLGSPRDDSLNAFTARMLLLLESQPLHDDAVYARLLERIVGFYYRDFADNAKTFLPMFLINDILRFWRTLTLNYEHHRLKLLDLTGEELERKKADSALKNYKLKVSRAATCFSMVANLSAEPAPVELATVLDLCRMTPTERLERLRRHGEDASHIVDQLERAYGEFLSSVQRPDEDLLREFADDDARKAALRSAARYGDLIFQLLDAVIPRDRMRYLVI